MATREEKTKARIQKTLRKYVPLLERARQRNINEADTSGRVYDMISDILGYDKYLEATGEYRVRGQYVDYAIKLDGEIKYFIEVKAVGVTLNQNHLRQVISYAVDEGVEWAVLTNGWMWQLYHIAYERPISVELVAEADLLAKDKTPAVDLLCLISKEGVAAGKAAEYWATKLALSTPNLVKALLSEPVINAMRREFRRITEQRLSAQELAGLLLSQVISPEAAGGESLKTVFAPTKRRRSRKAEEDYSVDRLLEGKAGEVVGLFRSLASEILSLSSEIEEVPSKLYVSYKRGRNFCECVIQKKKLLLHLDIPHSELKDPQGIAQDYSNIGHYGTGETQVSVSPGDDLQYVVGLVRQAHDLTL